MKTQPSDTIAAISTPRGSSGIAVLRISGKDALSVLQKIFNADNKSKPVKQRAIHGWIVDGEEPVDEVVLLCPQGERFNQHLACDFSKKKRIILISGHYEGFDERIREHLATREISIGDFVLTGGEVPAMAVVDAVTRLIPGVLGDAESIVEESFSNNLLEYPQYTRPQEYENMSVPEVLLSGDPKKIDEWRKEEALKRTKRRRPDLLKK